MIALEDIHKSFRDLEVLRGVSLVVPEGGDEAAAQTALQRAKRGCLVSNSLKGEQTLETEVIVG